MTVKEVAAGGQLIEVGGPHVSPTAKPQFIYTVPLLAEPFPLIKPISVACGCSVTKNIMQFVAAGHFVAL